ncbi:unnamed protein product, partial [Didymodactylos carnosus]
AELKDNIRKYLGIPCELQSLYYKGQQLINERAISDYKIYSGSVQLQVRYYIRLIQLDCEQEFGLVLANTLIISDLKKEIEKRMHIPTNQQFLCVNGNIDQNSLQTIINNSDPFSITIQVASKDTSTGFKMLIFSIELPNSDRYVIFFDKTKTISQLKMYIEDNYAFAVDAQLFNYPLATSTKDNNTSLHLAGIENGTLLSVSSTFKGIYLKTDNQSSAKNLNTQSINSVKQVKEEIYQRLKVYPYRQQLSFMCSPQRIVRKQKLLKDYGLYNGCIMVLQILDIKCRIFRVKLATGKLIEVEIDIGETVLMMKMLIEVNEGIESGCQILMKDNDELFDDDILADRLDRWYGPLFVKIVLGGPLTLDTSVLAPKYDYDFTQIDDTGAHFNRGGHQYSRPVGCMRIALKVGNKYPPDDLWLGKKGDDPNEWPVSYHGTGRHNALSIAEEGFRLSEGKRFLHGK